MARGQQRGGGQGDPVDWVTRAADDAVRHAGEGAGVDQPITCASGASPSGRIHLGNLREFITVHFVVEELRRRGLKARHLHSWDDYDRFRKVPGGVDPAWAEHIGRPLSAVPDPEGCHESWAEHYKAPLRASLAEMGIEMEEVSQTQMYRAGTYREGILTAVRRRAEVDAILDTYRTKKAESVAANPQVEATEFESTAEEEVEAVPGDDLARFPFKPFCRECGRDTVTLTSYDDDSTDLAYTCNVCGFEGVTNLTTQDEGKLVWKVDWPMRWAFEGVTFEPGGADHATPGSSYTVGKEVVAAIYGGRAPSFIPYGFVGFDGVQKMSSSAGGAPVATDALQILEPAMLRWLYVRRNAKQAFDIAFGPQVIRLYDEWDALGKKAADPDKRDGAVLAYERAISTSTAGVLPAPRVLVPFRLLSSVADVTAGSDGQISRIIASSGYPHDSVSDLEPRLSRATAWTERYVPDEERTQVRTAADADRLSALSPQESEWVRVFLDHLPSPLDLDGVTSVVYGTPKIARGLSVDDAPNDEVKADQKDFFKLLYNLLVDADRGPRLPTLILALGEGTVRSLLGGALGDAGRT